MRRTLAKYEISFNLEEYSFKAKAHKIRKRKLCEKRLWRISSNSEIQVKRSQRNFRLSPPTVFVGAHLCLSASGVCGEQIEGKGAETNIAKAVNPNYVLLFGRVRVRTAEPATTHSCEPFYVLAARIPIETQKRPTIR